MEPSGPYIGSLAPRSLPLPGGCGPLYEPDLSTVPEIESNEQRVWEQFSIRGVSVTFPYRAYDCQKVYMEKVIEACQTSSNALLESPTGTGKTICLLCSGLSWLRDQHFSENCVPGKDGSGENQKTQIIYASRTHSQLKQVVRELRRSEYKNVSIAVLGSREQLCVSPEVRSQSAQLINANCRRVIQARRCAPYFASKRKECFPTEPLDIEELVKWGQTNKICPYYMAREVLTAADVILLPYGYLLDPLFRSSVGLRLNRNVIFFDEAHNLSSMSAETTSFDWCCTTVTNALCDVEFALKRVMDPKSKLDNDLSVKDCGSLLEKIRRLDMSFRLIDHSFSTHNVGPNAVDVSSEKFSCPSIDKLLKTISPTRGDRSARGQGATRPGSLLFDILSDCLIAAESWSTVLKHIEQASSICAEERKKEGNITNSLAEIAAAIRLLADVAENRMKHLYRFHIYWRKGIPAQDEDEQDLFLCFGFWSQSALVSMNQLKKAGVRCCLLTSGTLRPLSFTVHDLGVPFPIRLENPHVVERTQVFCGICSVGPSNVSLNSSYINRSSSEYQREIGNLLVNVSRIVPDGLLVFFPSYSFMSLCLENWQRTQKREESIWTRITKQKAPVVEPTSSRELKVVCDAYYQHIREPRNHNGSIFFAVCRGKVSEGLDFADSYGRAVVVIGLPYPSFQDPKIRVHRDYLEEAKSKGGGSRDELITGREWYTMETVRAVNQAIGRIIRHRTDYGAILLVDQRFSGPSLQSYISLWLQPFICAYSQFGPLVRDLTAFLRVARNLHGPGGRSGASFATPSAVPPSPTVSSMQGMVHVETGDEVHQSRKQDSPPKDSALVVGEGERGKDTRKPFAEPFVGENQDVTLGTSPPAPKRARIEDKLHAVKTGDDDEGKRSGDVQSVSVPSEQSKSPDMERNNRRKETEEFLQLVRKFSSPTRFKSFVRALKDFKTGQISLEEAMKEFSAVCSGKDFMREEMRKYVPRNLRAAFDQRMEEDKHNH